MRLSNGSIPPPLVSQTYIVVPLSTTVSSWTRGWVSGLVVAPKPCNPKDVRVCGDYHPLPTVVNATHYQRLMSFLKKCRPKIFSQVDLRTGNHQIPLPTESRPITSKLLLVIHYRFLHNNLTTTTSYTKRSEMVMDSHQENGI